MKALKYALIATALTSAIAADAATTHGVNPANIDPSVAPQDDFYDYACGGWIKANPIGDEYSRFGTFDELGENNRKQLRDLFDQLSASEQAKGTVGQKVRDIYLLGMDSVRLNREGADPVKADLQFINAMKRAQLTDMVIWEHAGIGSPFFGCGVEADMLNSNINTLYISQPGLGLPDRDYYLSNEGNMKEIRAQYVKYLEDIFAMSGYTKKDAKRAAKNIMALETKLAEYNWDRVRLRDIASQYNPTDVATLQANYPFIDWNAYFKGIGIDNVGQVVLMQPDVMQKVNTLVGTLTDQQIKDYMAYNYLSSAIGYLGDDFIRRSFEFSRLISGKKEITPRWKRALNVPNGMLGEAVGELYVAKYFPKEAKERMLKLVGNLKKSLAEHIRSNTWMSDSTKINALVKLNSFTVKVGYPDKWRDYSAITVDPAQSYWTNVKGMIKAEAAREIAKYGKPVDKDEWGMSPQTVNAYYNPLANEIVFPAGILQPPFFDFEADDASNYGAIGVVIGHEMTHGFDDQGRQFDQDGNMTDWWAPADAEKFKALTDILADQYSSIVVIDDLHANGRFTLGENIADHGGLNVAYSAFKKTVQGQGNEKIDGFTPDQRFFLAYASVWAANIRPEEIVRRTKTDEHSLGRWRVNAALKNIPAFYEAFGIKAGDKMWLDPAKRVTIW